MNNVEPLREPTLVSVLVPVFNEEENIERCHRAITEVFAAMPDCRHEIIFSDNRSTDRSFEILRALAARDPAVRVVRLARNYGYQRSLLAAHKLAAGDCAVQIDCDLQDPPSLIPKMLGLWRAGHQVVYGVRRTRREGRGITFLRRVFYRVVRALSEDDLPVDAGEFRLVDRRILDELRRVDDTSPYLRGLISAMGFSQVGFAYDREARVAGESKFPLKAMIALGVDGVLNHSLIPLRLASLVSLAVGAATFLLLVGYIVGKFVLGQDWPAGFATTTVLLLVSIMLNAMFVGIVGEYVGRIFMQTKRRPTPIVDTMIGFSDGPYRGARRGLSLAGALRADEPRDVAGL